MADRDGWTPLHIRHTLFALLLLLPLTTFAAEFVVKDMRVEGLQRISEGTVFNYLPINIGDTVDGIRIGEAIRALYGPRPTKCAVQLAISSKQELTGFG